MLKKTLLTLSMALVLAFVATSSFAQMPGAGQIPPEMVEAFAKEKPLTQADVDAYIKMMPELAKAGGNPEAATKVYKDAGLSEIRFSYIMTKVSLGMSLGMGMTAEQLGLGDMPEAILPNKEEIELVKKNQEKVQAALMQMGQAMQQKQ